MRSLSLFAIVGLLVSLGCHSTALEHWLVGKAELEAGNYGQAIHRLEKSKQKDADFGPAYLALAAAYSREGNFPAVADNLRQYLTLNPEHDVAHLYLAECLLSMDETEAAREQYLQYLQVSHGYGPGDQRLAHAHQRLADLAVRSNDSFEESLFTGLVMLDEFYAARKGQVEFTFVADLQMLLEESQKRLNQAIALRPDDPRVIEAVEQLRIEQAALAQLQTDDPLKVSKVPSVDPK